MRTRPAVSTKSNARQPQPWSVAISQNMGLIFQLWGQLEVTCDAACCPSISSHEQALPLPAEKLTGIYPCEPQNLLRCLPTKSIRRPSREDGEEKYIIQSCVRRTARLIILYRKYLDRIRTRAGPFTNPDIFNGSGVAEAMENMTVL